MAKLVKKPNFYASRTKFTERNNFYLDNPHPPTEIHFIYNFPKSSDLPRRKLNVNIVQVIHPNLKVYSHLRFITRLRLIAITIGSRMGCTPIFVIAIAIPIHSIEKIDFAFTNA